MTKSLAAQLADEKRKRQELETKLRILKDDFRVYKEMRDKEAEDLKNSMYDRTLFDLQLALDAFLIVVHKLFGFGKNRCTQLRKAYNDQIRTMSQLIDNDLKDDEECIHAKSIVDRQLAEIFGDEAETWDVRYDMVKMRGDKN